MSEYLPEAYTDFRTSFPDVAAALDRVGQASDESGPLDEKTVRLVKLGIAIGGGASGSVRSNVRKALEAGATVDEIRQVAVAAITTIGFPASVAALGWIDEVMSA